MGKKQFFSKDREFYKILTQMLILTILHNLITHTVSVVDNVMLGFYSQSALSAASAVNELFFLVQQLAVSFGTSLIVLASRYWGEKKTDQIRTLTGTVLCVGVIFSLIIVFLCICFPHQILHFFVSSETLPEEELAYLSIVQWTFPLYTASMIFSCALRSVGKARTGFQAAILALIVNVVLNYLLIFGNFGFSQMGIRGAAIATLAARVCELSVFIYNLAKKDQKLRLFSKLRGPGGFFGDNKALRKSLTRIAVPITAGIMLWSLSVPAQNTIMRQLSAEALAANAAFTTVFQYLKVIITAVSNVSAALIGNAIGTSVEKSSSGSADFSEVRAKARTLSVLSVAVGLILGITLLLLREPLLSLHNLTGATRNLAGHMILVQSIVLVGMSYQLSVNDGILLGGGDISFAMSTDLISVWVIVIPLSLLAAYIWKLPAEWIVILLQSDQIFKCLPVFLRFRSYRWISLECS